MAVVTPPQTRWSFRHPLAFSGLVALCCVGGGFVGTLAAGGSVAHVEPAVWLLPVMALPISHGSVRRQRARLIRNFS
jgi:hypothetical protein